MPMFFNLDQILEEDNCKQNNCEHIVSATRFLVDNTV